MVEGDQKFIVYDYTSNYHAKYVDRLPELELTEYTSINKKQEINPAFSILFIPLLMTTIVAFNKINNI